MSFQVLVIPEDPTYNGYILKPLSEALLTLAGHPAPRVTVLEKAGTRGYPAACEYVRTHLQDWPMMDLFLFLPDRDGQRGVAGAGDRMAQIADLEKRAREEGRCLLGCPAIEEIEVWLMAGHQEKLASLGLRWSDIRKEAKPSQGSFVRFLEAFGDQSVGRGRKRLMQETCQSMNGVLARCEELQALLDRIRSGDGRPLAS